MSKAAVICEFNPFHNGHKFLLEKIKSTFADEVICIMSGSFVQRGDVAVTDKFARTICALENGADMVVELPTVYALAPAQVFAAAGVQMAAALGCELLCFGAENSMEELNEALDTLDNDQTQARIAACMNTGTAYPRALSAAVNSRIAAIIEQPNNILALEYIRACRAHEITPVAVMRRGVEHDAALPEDGYASAAAIREMIAQGEQVARYTPMQIERPYSAADLEPLLLYALKTKTPESIAPIAGIGEGLEYRISRCAAEYNSIEEILSAVKTKRYTLARLRRTLYAILFGITQEMQQRPVPYLRVLGVKADKKHLIAGTLPLIVDVRRGYDALDNSAKEIFNVDLAAAAALNATGVSTVPLNEFSRGMILS